MLKFLKLINGLEFWGKRCKPLACCHERWNVVLDKNKTWTLGNKPKMQNVIDCKWNYKIKEGESKDETIKFKAILVAKALPKRMKLTTTKYFSM